MIAGTEFYVAVDPDTGMPHRWSRPSRSTAMTSGLSGIDGHLVVEWPNENEVRLHHNWRDLPGRDWMGGDRGLGQWEWVGPTITGLLKGVEIWYTIDTQNRIQKSLEHDQERRDAATLEQMQIRDAQARQLMEARQAQGLDPMTGEPLGMVAGTPADDVSREPSLGGMKTSTMLMVGGIGLAVMMLMGGGGGGRRERRRDRF